MQCVSRDIKKAKRVWDQVGLFCIKMAFFDVSAHTLHSLGQVTVTVKRILVQGLRSHNSDMPGEGLNARSGDTCGPEDS